MKRTLAEQTPNGQADRTDRLIDPRRVRLLLYILPALAALVVLPRVLTPEVGPIVREWPATETPIAIATRGLGNEHILTDIGNRITAVAWSRDNPPARTAVASALLEEGTVNDVVADEQRARIIAGGSGRRVQVLESGLTPLAGFSVNGSITGLALAPNGDILATFGIGAYSERYFVGRFSSTGEVRWETPVGFTTRALGYADGFTYFGTADSRVGVIDESGNELRRTTLRRPITVLETFPAIDGAVVGDEQGGLYVVTPSGDVTMDTTIGDFPIRAIAWDHEERVFVVGDGDGEVFVVSPDGDLLATSPAFDHGDRIVAIVESGEPGGGDYVAYSRSGRVAAVDPSAAVALATGRTLAFVRVVATIVAVVAFLALVASAINPVRRGAMWVGRQIHRSRLAYLLLLPSIVTLAIFSYYPIVTAFYYSFTNFTLASPLRFVGFANYVRLASDPYFWKGMGNLLRILITQVLKEVTMPLLIAELVFWLRNKRHQYFFRTAFIVPSIVPGVVMVLLWRMIYDPSVGLINQILNGVGLQELATAWLGNEATAIWAVIFAGFPWIGVFAFLVYLGGLINISQDIFDAAKIDGIGVIERFRRIEFPMLRPQFRIILFFAYVASIQSFANIWIFTRGGPGSATYVPGLQMFIKVSEGNYGYASAIGVVLFLMAFIGTVLNFRFGKKVDE